MVFDYCRYRQVRETMQICENGKNNNYGKYKTYLK